jgi:catechol 2,3-dioxygenase-like lactoylglutathione lyase family enzyme
MTAAQARLNESLQLSWIDDNREEWPLTVFGKPVSLNLRIAHASTGVANFELIEAVPDTPWVTSQAIVQHHVCLHSPESSEVCHSLEALGYQRLLGAAGDPQGYFQDPDGLLIEIVGDMLLAYLNDYYEQSQRAMARTNDAA